MYFNGALPEMRHKLGNDEASVSRASTVVPGQSGQRTIGGAVTMAVAPVALVVAASYPTAAAFVVAATVGTAVVARFASGDPSPDDASQQPEAEESGQNKTVARSD